MPIFSGIVLFASIWFLVLFLVLPIGARSQADAGEVTPGTPASAPHRPRLGRKVLIVTAITIVLWLACYVVIVGGIITRDDMRNLDRLIR